MNERKYLCLDCGSSSTDDECPECGSKMDSLNEVAAAIYEGVVTETGK